MSLISVSDLTFGYEGRSENVFEHLTFRFDTSWKLGLVGRNGRGKTTLLRLLCGELDSHGSVLSPVSFDYFPFAVNDPSEDTLCVLSKIAPHSAQWQLERELSLLDVAPDALCRPFKTLSFGERTKALLAALFLREGRFLLIDEPTNHLDQTARHMISDYLSRKQGFLLASHDRAVLDGCVDHILALNRAGIEVQQGNFSSWQYNRQLQDQFERSEHDKLQKEVRRLADAAGRTVRWANEVEQSKFGTRNSGLRPDRGYLGRKSAKMMKRAKSAEHRREEALSEKASLLQNVETAEELAVHPLTHFAQTLVEVRDLAVLYEKNPVFEGVSFSIKRGERVALTGKNGSGKSSILKLLAGQDIPHRGTVRLASGLILSYVPQDASHLQGELRVFAQQNSLDESLFLTILRKLDFPRTQFEKRLEDLSAGQKKKVLLARSLCERAHLYLWDEPLNYIDVFSRMQIERLLCEYAPAMLFVEHDGAFVGAVATREVVL